MARLSRFQAAAETATDDKPAMLDWGVVSAAYKGFSREYNLQKEQDCPFVLFALETVLELDIDDAKTAVTDGGQDRGIDAVVIDRDENTIHLFQCKETKKFKRSDCNFPSTEVDKVLSFIDDLITGRLVQNRSCNSLLQEKVDAIWEMMQETVLDFRIHFFSNGTGLAYPDKRRFESYLAQYDGHVTLHEHTLSKIATRIPGQAGEDVEYSLRFVEDQLYSRADGNIKGFSCAVKLEALVDFLRDPLNPDSINEILFRENLRLYLGKGNRNNSRIQNSATAQNNHEFWYLNNGLTIICKHLQYQPKSNAPVRMVNPQIVNGCQTAHSIFEAKDSSEHALDGATISVKIVETTDASLVDRVAEATNSQTTIKTRDLRANDLVQIKLEASLEKAGFFYERKKHQHKGKQQNLRIDALKIGQVMLAYYNQDPNKAKTLSNEIFGNLFRTVFDPATIDANKVIVLPCHRGRCLTSGLRPDTPLPKRTREAGMTSPKDPEDNDPGDCDPEKANGTEAPKDARTDDGEDALNLAYLSPHEKAQGEKAWSRAHYANADERIQSALSHVNPETAVTFLRKTHGPQAGQEALMRALMAERQHHRTAARYWLEVYERMTGG
eukprot:s1_g2496.t1